MGTWQHDPIPASMPDRELCDALDYAPILLWRTDARRQCVWFNLHWHAFTGASGHERGGNNWAEHAHPDDVEQCMQEYARACEQRIPFSTEYRLQRADGEYRWMLTNGSPYLRHGDFAGYIGSCVDITMHRDSERTQQRLIDELNHRVKNTLSLVQALAHQSFGEHGDERANFEARLSALAAAHDVLSERHWEKVTLSDIIRAALKPTGEDIARISVSGPLVPLHPQAAVTFAIAIHELCSNAAKFGALSTPAGRVAIHWSVLIRPTLVLEFCWREENGPPVTAPARTGFGSRMLSRALAAEISGDVSLDYAASGLRCRISAPLDQLLPRETTIG